MSPRPDTLFPHTTLFRPATRKGASRTEGCPRVQSDRLQSCTGWSAGAGPFLRRPSGRQRVNHGIVELLLRFQRRFVVDARSEEHTSELQSLMRISYAVICLKKQKEKNTPKLTT